MACSYRPPLNQNSIGGAEMTAKILTQSRLKELLHYNPDSGIFTRITVLSNRNKAGDILSGDNGDGYVRGRVDNKSYYLHRLAFLYMTGRFPDSQVDHIDHNPTNNRWDNLREVSHSENHRNQRIRSNNTSGYVGVSRTRYRWAAEIMVDGVKIHLGHFKRKTKAIAARESASKKYGFHPNHGKTV